VTESAVAVFNPGPAIGKKIVGDEIRPFDRFALAEVIVTPAELYCEIERAVTRNAAMFLILHRNRRLGKLSQRIVGVLTVAKGGQQPLNLHLP